MYQDNDRVNMLKRSPTWIHSDIMDDNIHMEACAHAHFLDGCASGASSTVNDTPDVCNAERIPKNWIPTHILDFSNLIVGNSLLMKHPFHN